MNLQRWIKHLSEALLAMCLLGMVVAVFGNVVLRYGWGTGWVVSEELSRLLFVWLVAIAATLTFAEGKHLGFDLVTARLQGLPAAALRWLTRVLIALSLYYLITGAWAQVVVGMDSHSPVMNYPLALGAGAILVMGVCMAVLLLLQALAELRGTPASGESA
ncbi:MAG: TRAP transporter small permease [Hydrogenophaga sp.]|uniref:TRAP transporter small permease n=1 Tax=Hydrogenophaga sp. TaxID=1904254 RepID=UPI001D67111F|nr:TRAP transporter small permease [Hydrogenophaga sp.]MBX3611252.1 TRAP transporter small permease [Hydrogenophaga sp.]